jgi:hypothetical protein
VTLPHVTMVVQVGHDVTRLIGTLLGTVPQNHDRYVTGDVLNISSILCVCFF